MADEKEPTRPGNLEVLGADGKTLSAGGPLADIFDKIESGKSDGLTAETVLKQEPIKQEVKEGSVKESGKIPSLTKPQASPLNEEQNKVETKETEKKEEELKEKKEEKKIDGGLDGNLTERQEEITRESMRKKEPEKKEEKGEDKKEPEKTDEKEEEVPEDELKPLPHDSSKTTKRILSLLKKAELAQGEVATTKSELQKRDEKLKQLEDELGKAKSADPKTNEAIKGQMEELSMLRRRFELQKDPEVKEKFDAKVEGAETSIMTLLKDKGAGEPLLNLIKEEGGWAKFASSSRPVTLSDGKQVTSAELADIVSKNLPYADRKSLEAAATEQVQVQRDKERYFKEQEATATKYFEERQKQEEQNKKNFEGYTNTVQTTIKDAITQATEKDGWLKESAIPQDATEEQKKEIEEDNKHTKKLQALLTKSLNTKDLKEAVEITFDSVRYYKELRRAEKLEKQIEGLRKDLEVKDEALAKFKSAGRSTPRGGSISSPPPAKDPPKKMASLEDALDALSRGEVLTTDA